MNKNFKILAINSRQLFVISAMLWGATILGSFMVWPVMVFISGFFALLFSGILLAEIPNLLRDR